MKKFQPRKKLKKILKSPKLLLISAIVVTFVMTLLFANKGLWRQIALRHEVGELEAQQTTLSEQEQQLNKRIDLLTREEPTMIERIARERYRLKRPGEIIYREEKK